jgi:hypothetical protein
MTTRIDSRQAKKRLANTRIASVAGETVESIIDKVDAAIVLNNIGTSTDNALVRMDTTTGKLIQGSGITADDSNNLTGIASETVQTSIVTVKNQESVSIDAATGSNQTLTTPTTPIIRLTNASLVSLDGIPAGTAGQQITIINDTGTTILVNNDTGATVADRVYTGTKKPLSLKDQASILLKYEGTTARWRIIGGSGAGTGGSGSGGGELADLMYYAAIRDSFTDILGATPTDVTANKTDSSLFDIANELFKLNYDAAKTLTGTGTAMALSATITQFTPKAGDILVFGSEARKITVWTSFSNFVIESAFATDPSTAACCISQALHTVDLNNFTAGGTGLAASSQYSADIDEIMLGYQDSTTLLDVIPDYGTAPVIAFTASADGTSYTTTRVRQTSLSSSETVVTCPTSSTNLYLRFFANKTTGAGTVNLLSYKVFFQKQIGQTAGGTYNTAFARPTSSIAQNCTHSVASGKSRFVFTFPYTRGLNITEASGSILEVIANGQIIPRYTSGITDIAQAYFTEINDTTIDMDIDYSSAGIDFQFKVQRVGIIDTNNQNTVRISALETDVVPVSKGGTGVSTLALNNVILGNSASAVSTVAPSTARNVLMSNGTTWASTSFTLPTIQKFTSGSGTYTSPANVMYIKVLMVGAGGGGGGRTGNGGTGGNTTFGTASANGATGGTSASGGNAGIGGSSSLGSLIGTALSGGYGGGLQESINNAGGSGASSPIGGAGGGGIVNAVGTNAIANSGSGGGGSGANNSGSGSAAGGGAGGYVNGITIAGSYSYSVGSAGTGGTGSPIGGNGGSGYIEVIEYYQ